MGAGRSRSAPPDAGGLAALTRPPRQAVPREDSEVIKTVLFKQSVLPFGSPRRPTVSSAPSQIAISSPALSASQPIAATQSHTARAASFTDGLDFERGLNSDDGATAYAPGSLEATTSRFSSSSSGTGVEPRSPLSLQELCMRTLCLHARQWVGPDGTTRVNLRAMPPELVARLFDMARRHKMLREHLLPAFYHCAVTEVRLAQYPGVCDAWVPDLTALRGLRVLDLSHCAQLTDDGLRSLAALGFGKGCLATLRLRSCAALTDASVALVVHALAHALTDLDLSGCARLTDASLARIVNVRGLRALSLNRCQRMTSAYLCQLGLLSQLRALDVGLMPAVNDDVLDAWGICTQRGAPRVLAAVARCLLGADGGADAAAAELATGARASGVAELVKDAELQRGRLDSDGAYDALAREFDGSVAAAGKVELMCGSRAQAGSDEYEQESEDAGSLLDADESEHADWLEQRGGSSMFDFEHGPSDASQHQHQHQLPDAAHSRRSSRSSASPVFGMRGDLADPAAASVGSSVDMAAGSSLGNSLGSGATLQRSPNPASPDDAGHEPDAPRRRSLVRRMMRPHHRAGADSAATRAPRPWRLRKRSSRSLLASSPQSPQSPSMSPQSPASPVSPQSPLALTQGHAASPTSGARSRASYELMALQLQLSAVPRTGLYHLSSLDASFCAVGDGGCAALAELRNLRELDVTQSPAVTAAGAASLARLPRLERLAAAQCHGLRAAAAQLLCAPALRALSLARVPVSSALDEWAAGAGAAARLEELDLGDSGVGDRALAALARAAPALRVLRLEACRVSARGLERLADGGAAATLQTLDLADVPVGDGAVAHVSRLTALRELNLFQTQLSDAGVRALCQQLPLLVRLNADTVDAGDGCLRGLRHLRHLRHLDLFGAKVTDGGCAEIARAGLPQLESLELCGGFVSDLGVAYLCGLRSKLRRLNLSQNPGVTDQGLRRIAQTFGPSLRSLGLANARLTRHAVTLLYSFPFLEELVVRGCRFPEGLLDALRRALPNLWFVLA